MLATYADKRKQLDEELQEEGEVLTGVNGGKYLNPKTNLLLSLDEKTIKLFSMLGLTPTDRSKLGISIESQEIDPITQIRQGSKLQALRDKHSQARNALN
jgi:P27 family predicted phage terminase small subunit